METKVAYAVWRNPDQNNRIECVAVPIKTMKTKVTLAMSHPAFPGVRLDTSQVDLCEETAFRRFVERRTKVQQSALATLSDAERDLDDARTQYASSTYLRVLAVPRNG
jgi:hypothetical protein